MNGMKHIILGVAGILAAALITLVSGMETKACEASFEDLASDPGVVNVTPIAAPAAPAAPEAPVIEEPSTPAPVEEAVVEPTPAPAPTPAVVEETAPVIEEPSTPAPVAPTMEITVESVDSELAPEQPAISTDVTPIVDETPVESEPFVAVAESEKEDTVIVEPAKTIQVKAAKIADVKEEKKVEEPEEINIPWYLGFLLLLILFARRYEVVEMSENKENDRTRKFFSLRKAAEYVRDYEFSDSEVLVVAINNRFRKDKDEMVYAIDKAANLFAEPLWVQSDSEYDILNDVLGYEREAEEEYADLVEAALAAA